MKEDEGSLKKYDKNLRINEKERIEGELRKVYEIIWSKIKGK